MLKRCFTFVIYVRSVPYPIAAPLSVIRFQSWSLGIRIGVNLAVTSRLRERNRHIPVVAERSGEGPFTRPAAAAQAWRPELVFMPHFGH